MASPGPRADTKRPSPDALLAAEQRERRAKLKVFLGAAAGVGKTYAMLEAAQSRMREGVDVVIGVIETHGREETAALARGLEVVPLRQVAYRGQTLSEMDLDAILARRPGVVLVDELAHTNVPGSRHAKRYLDVEELLDAGIDVYTTLNVQHIESLNDIVAQITGVRVRETVPDRLTERADELELVDLSPEALQQRLREGRVYVPEQARAAIRSFFRAGNLAALRELALRQTADRVEQQMQTYMAGHAIAGPWPASERIMVCVSSNPLSPRLVRTARRVAESRHSPWLAVYVETPGHYRLPETDRDRITETLRLAELLGGEAVTIPGQDVAEELTGLARSRNVTQIIMGKSVRSRWSELWHGSLTLDVIRRSGDIDVLVATDTPDESGGLRAARRLQAGPLRGFALSALAVAVVGLVARQLQLMAGIADVDVVFLAAVVFSAATYGLWPSILASLLSVLAYDYYFVLPYHTLTVGRPQDVLALIVYLAVAVLVSRLTSRMREQAQSARQREARTSALHALSRRIAAARDLPEVEQVIVEQVGQLVAADTLLVLPDSANAAQMGIYPPSVGLGDAERAAAVWAVQHGQATGRGSDTLVGIPWLFVPLTTAGGTFGVLGVRPLGPSGLLSPDQGRLLAALAGQAAVALERVRLAAEVDQARLAKERERLQNTLLSSISHDLRTPLASVLGAATSLLQDDAAYDAAARTDLLTTIREEAERLNRFVGNLLDTTRIESGALQLRRDWVDIGEVIGAAVTRLDRSLSPGRVELGGLEGLPMLRLDFVLMEQVLVNLLDNAVKYSAADSPIRVHARVCDRQLVVEIGDEGIGVPPADLERIFDKFYRVQGTARQGVGTGLGLSICKGIVEAHGGSIAAKSPTCEGGRGTTVSVSLPIEAGEPTVDREAPACHTPEAKADE